MILGVAAGVFSFLVMGSMAEHFRGLARQFNRLFENRIFISEKPSFWAGGGIISDAKLDKARQAKGVEKAIPLLITRRSSDSILIVGIPQVVIGIPPGSVQDVSGGFPLLFGSAEMAGESPALMGFDAARDEGAVQGGTLMLEGRAFHVAGVFQKTGSILDGQVFIPLTAAQEIYNRQGLLTSILVIPSAGADAEILAKSLKAGVPGVEVIPPSRFRRQVDKALLLWNTLTLGAALAACIAGTLSIVVVMLSSVNERVVEIGIKKAIGAENSHIVMEFLAESVLCAIPGWMLGGLLSVVFSMAASPWMRPMGAHLFDLSPRLFLVSLAGVIIIGALAGTYPAYRASLIDPVEVLKVRY
jgi:putative ABC transport system permease protein